MTFKNNGKLSHSSLFYFFEWRKLWPKVAVDQLSSLAL